MKENVIYVHFPSKKAPKNSPLAENPTPNVLVMPKKAPRTLSEWKNRLEELTLEHKIENLRLRFQKLLK